MGKDTLLSFSFFFMEGVSGVHELRELQATDLCVAKRNLRAMLPSATPVAHELL
jgi:hypothetical protein